MERISFFFNMMANFFPQSFSTANEKKVIFRFQERRKWGYSSKANGIQLHLFNKGVVHSKNEDLEDWRKAKRKETNK